jgi:hypothetical protein
MLSLVARPLPHAASNAARIVSFAAGYSRYGTENRSPDTRLCSSDRLIRVQ